MLVRRATRHDLETVKSLLTECRLPLAGVDKYFEDFVVGIDEGELVACAGIEHYPPVAVLRSVAVAPSRRGEGLGQSITRYALDQARARGANTVYLLTETAAEFFPRFGFAVTAREEVERKTGMSELVRSACPVSATCMKLVLSDPPC